MIDTKKFPDDSSENRLRLYGRYEKLLSGDHFSVYAKHKEFLGDYNRLRYLVANFAGLISKVMADVLFGEKVQVQTGEDKSQEFIDALFEHNDLNSQFYESSLMNSARGDALFRVRVEDEEIKIEDINPAMYFPNISENYRQEPKTKTLAWREDHGGHNYLVKEIHSVGKIEMQAFLMKSKDDNTIVNKVPLDDYNLLSGHDYEETQETGIDEIPIVHIPNYRIKNEYWGLSDYGDLETLFLALNNRITKIDNILDKHSDPILAIPEGILDEDGNVRKEALGLIEKGADGDVPEYIVWNANLDSAFKEIDEIVKMLFLISEVSPDVVGLDTGRASAESGRALKLRMVRTLAKKNRKSLYYEDGLKKVFRLAGKFASNGYMVGGKKYKVKDISPTIRFADGVIDDKVEEISLETTKLEAGLTTRARSLAVLEDMGVSDAEEIIKNVDEEKNNKGDFDANKLFDNGRRLINDGEAT